MRPAHDRVRARAQGASDAALAPGDEAARIALATLEFGEAPRVGVLGDSGTGKTFAMCRIVELYLTMSPGVVLVIDDKQAQPQFKGVYRRDRDDLARNPVNEERDGRVIVFRGDPFSADGGVDPESIAELQLVLARKGRPSLVAYDELGKAASGGQWLAGRKSRIAWAFGKGRSQGAASLWGDQETESVPREAFNQSNAILGFRMVGNPVRLLGARGYLVGGAEKVLPTLTGEPLPPEERGQHLLLRRGTPWDGKIYKHGRVDGRA